MVEKVGTEERKSPRATEESSTCVPWYLYQNSEVAAVRAWGKMSLVRHGLGCDTRHAERCAYAAFQRFNRPIL